MQWGSEYQKRLKTKLVICILFKCRLIRVVEMGGGQKYKSTYARCINNVCPNFFSTKIVRESTARGHLNFLYHFSVVKKGKDVNFYDLALFQGLPLKDSFWVVF